MPNLTQYLPVIAAVIALGLIAAVLYRKHWLPMPAEEPDMKSDDSERTPQSPAIAAEQGRWQVEMHEFAREMKGELDSKMSALQALIAQAKAESERLERLLAKAERAAEKADLGEPRG